MGITSSERLRSKPVAVAGWLLAGAPILASGTQALARLAGTPVEFWPVIGGLAATVKQVSAFQQMALAFDPQSPLVLGLFLLVVTAWIMLGLSLFRPTTVFEDYAREVRGGALLASTILYGVLFLGAYWPSVTNGATLGELLALTGLLVGVQSGIYVAAKAQPRTNGNRLLNRAERRLDELNRELTQAIEEATNTLSELGPNTDINVAELTEVAARRSQISDIKSEVEQTRDLPENQREIAARQLTNEEIEALEEESASSVVEVAVRTELSNWLDNTHGSVTARSQFGESYTLENFRQYRQIELEGVDPLKPTPLAEVSHLAEELDNQSVGLKDSISVVNTVDRHVSDLRSGLAEREEAFAELVTDTTSELDEAFNRIEGLPHDVEDYLSNAYRSGSVEGVSHVGIIRSTDGPNQEPGDLDRAMKLHHECRFEEAKQLARQADAKARKLTQAVGFTKRIVLTTNDELPGIDTPEWSSKANPFFTEELIDRGVNARLDAVRLNPDWATGRIEYSYQRSGSFDSNKGPDEENEGTPNYLIQDGVRWLFNALKREEIGEVRESPKTSPDEQSDVRVEVHDKEMPKSKADPEIMEAAADHVVTQDAFDVEVDDDLLPEVVSFDIRVDGEVPPSQPTVGDELLNSYKNNTNQT